MRINFINYFFSKKIEFFAEKIWQSQFCTYLCNVVTKLLQLFN